MPRQVVEIANPRRHGETYTSLNRAVSYCAQGIAFFLSDGRLKFKSSVRKASDAYVDPRGTIWWNGSRSVFIEGQDIAMFPPCCNVAYPKTGTKRAAQRYA